MASKGKILHNQKRLNMANNAFTARQTLKEAIVKTDNMKDKLALIFKLDKNPNKSLTRYRKRCQICGRPRGIMQGDICRIHFRDMASFGLLAGIKKASW